MADFVATTDGRSFINLDLVAQARQDGNALIVFSANGRVLGRVASTDIPLARDTSKK